MDYNKFIRDILKASNGILEDAEVLISMNERLSIQTFRGEINKHEIAESGGLSLRGVYKGKMGYTYTEKLDPSEIDNLIEEVKSNSLYIEDDGEEIQSASESYEEFSRINLDRNKKTIEEKIEYLLKLEEEIVKYDERVYEAMTGYTETRSKLYLGNSRGIGLEDESTVGVISTSSFVREKEEVKTGSAYRIIYDFKEFDECESLAKECVTDAIDQLGGKSIESGKYKIVFENMTFANLLSAFSSTFSAENIQKNLSLFKGKLGKKVGSKKLTIIDNPFLMKGLGSSHFDSEGVATEYKEIIKDGVLETYLHNSKTGKKDGVKSTGNGSRSYKGSLNVAPTNLYVKEGENTLEELLNTVGQGIYIDDLQGLHSGLNPVSGDFSLSAAGFKILDGGLGSPVNQITIAGNLFELLEEIEYIANDLKFSPQSGGNIGSPSVVIRELAISGE